MEKVRNFIIVIVLIVCGSLAGKLVGSLQNQNMQGSYSSVKTQELSLTEEDMNKVIALLNRNKLFKTMLELNPDYRQELKKDMLNVVKDKPWFLDKVRKGTLTYDEIEGKLPSTERELGKYIVKAPDEELYQTLLVEFKHAKKNKCQVYPLTNEDREETANAKTKMILAAYNTPYQGKAISAEKVEKITKKILENYKKNGGDMNKIAIMSGLKAGYLTSADKCQVMTDFFEATFSLPKKETVMFYRANGQYFTM